MKFCTFIFNKNWNLNRIFYSFLLPLQFNSSENNEFAVAIQLIREDFHYVRIAVAILRDIMNNFLWLNSIYDETIIAVTVQPRIFENNLGLI